MLLVIVKKPKKIVFHAKTNTIVFKCNINTTLVHTTDTFWHCESDGDGEYSSCGVEDDWSIMLPGGQWGVINGKWKHTYRNTKCHTSINPQLIEACWAVCMNSRWIPSTDIDCVYCLEHLVKHTNSRGHFLMSRSPKIFFSYKWYPFPWHSLWSSALLSPCAQLHKQALMCPTTLAQTNIVWLVENPAWSL